jgi:hypothetical protein
MGRDFSDGVYLVMCVFLNGYLGVSFSSVVYIYVFLANSCCCIKGTYRIELFFHFRYIHLGDCPLTILSLFRPIGSVAQKLTTSFRVDVGIPRNTNAKYYYRQLLVFLHCLAFLSNDQSSRGGLKAHSRNGYMVILST